MFGNRKRPVYQEYLNSLPKPIIHDNGGGVVYYGYCERLGVGTDAPKWLIIRETTAGGVTTPEYAGGNALFEHIWDDRTTLSYSR